MLQRFRLDRAGLVAYLGLSVLACHRGSPALVPAAAKPVSAAAVAGWVRATEPAGHTLHRFKWLFRDERSSAGGSGSARLAAPDSLRFDVRGPLGAGAAAAVVVGDSAIWTEPQDVIRKLVPNYPLMWALFGIARLPESGSTLRGYHDGTTAIWQYARGTDTTDYVRSGGETPKLVTEVRQAGKVLGRTETTLSPEGRPLSARLVVPGVPARLDITFVSSSENAAFPPRTWAPPTP